VSPRFVQSTRFILAGALAVASASWADAITLGGQRELQRLGHLHADFRRQARLTLGGQGTDIGEQIVKVGDLDLNTNNAEGLTLTVTLRQPVQGRDQHRLQR